MNEKDDIILEYLRAISPSAEPPTVIHYNIHRRADEFNLNTRTGGGFSLDTLRNRIRRLEDIGLADVVREKGKYRAITEDGVEYLAGDLDAGELDDHQ